VTVLAVHLPERIAHSACGVALASRERARFVVGVWACGA